MTLTDEQQQQVYARRMAGMAVAALAREYQTTWNVISKAVARIALKEEESARQRSKPLVRGECVGCTCRSLDSDFEIEPLTSALMRKPGTCRRRE